MRHTSAPPIEQASILTFSSLLPPRMQQGPPADLFRAPDLWFEDARLVFQADDQLFRVSGDVLAAQSSVFQDMLSFPQPKPPDTVDGHLLIRLPDPAADITCFFKAIFQES